MLFGNAEFQSSSLMHLLVTHCRGLNTSSWSLTLPQEVVNIQNKAGINHTVGNTGVGKGSTGREEQF